MRKTVKMGAMSGIVLRPSPAQDKT
jgi:hypothetical protein